MNSALPAPQRAASCVADMAICVRSFGPAGRRRRFTRAIAPGKVGAGALGASGVVLRIGRIGLLLLAAALAGLLAWWFLRPVAVDVAQTRYGSAAEVVYATGAVEPAIWAKVTPLVRSRIAWHCRCEGTTVAAGDMLARLDDSAQRAELAQVEARAAFLSSELDRQTDLVARGTGTRVGLERSQSELAQAQSQVAALKARLTDYVIIAPIPGVVLRADGYVGEIASGEPLFWVGRMRPLRVVSEVNEEDVPRIGRGLPVLLRNDGFGQTALQAKVGEITPKGDPVSKTFRVYLDLPDDTPLRIGMSVEANIVVREKARALLLPVEAVVDGRVQALRDGRVQRVPVITDIRGARMIEITEGLAEGAVVLSPFRADLPDASRVAPSARPNAGGG